MRLSGASPAGPVRERPAPLAVLGLSLCVVAAAYGGALDVGFVWDDHALVVEDRSAHGVLAALSAFARPLWDVPLVGSVPAYYRPLVRLSYAVDGSLGGGAPWLFHLSNVLWHLVSCALVFVLARQLGARVGAAGLAAAFFGVFPRLTESVTWVAGRTDVLATALGLLALVLERRAVPTVTRRVGVALALLAALLCKELALFALAPLLVWAAARVRRGERALREEALAGVPLLVALGAFFAVRAVVLVGTRPLQLAAPTTWLASWGTSLRMVLTPWLPAAQIGCVTEAPGWALALGTAAVGAVVALALAWRARPDPLGLLAGAVVAVALPSVPVLGLSTIASDRFLYGPLALASVLLAWWLPRRLGAVAAAGALVVVLAAVTSARNAVWRSPLALAVDTVTRAERCNPAAAQLLGDALADQHRLAEALAWYRAAERRWRRPDSPTRLSVAATLSQQGEDQEALALTAALVAENPAWRRAALDLALFRLRAADVEGARTALAAARSRFGDDEAARALDALIAAEAGPLESEPALAARDDRLGAVGHALRRYLALAESEDPALRRTAAGWLLLHAERPHAEAALARLLALPDLPPEEAGAFRAVFDERFAVAAPRAEGW